MKSDSKLAILTQYTKKKVCENSKTKMLINDLGMNIVYMYQSTDKKSLLIVDIDSCSK